MPIYNFSGDTFVVFMDLCGFKELMRNIVLATTYYYYLTPHPSIKNPNRFE